MPTTLLDSLDARAVRKAPAAAKPLVDKFGRKLDAKTEARIAQYDKWIDKYAKAHDVDPELVRAVVRQESRGVASARSKTGVRGLMQVTAPIFKQYGNPKKKRTDPEASIEAGTAFLSALLKQYDGDAVKALAHYNSGVAAGKNPKAARWEGRKYVESILNMDLAKDYTPEKRWIHKGYQGGTEIPAPHLLAANDLQKVGSAAQVPTGVEPTVATDEGTKPLNMLGEQRRIPLPDYPADRMPAELNIPHYFSPREQQRNTAAERDAAEQARKEAYAAAPAGSVVGAAIERTHAIPAIYAWDLETQAGADEDPNYRVDNTRLEEDLKFHGLDNSKARRLMEARSERHYGAILANLVTEADAQRHLALVSPKAAVGLQLLTSVGDPVMVLPNLVGGRLLLGATRYQQLGRLGRGGAEAAAGAVVGSGQEAILEAGTNPELTKEDMVEAILQGALAGAILPGAIGLASRGDPLLRQHADAVRKGQPTKPDRDLKPEVPPMRQPKEIDPANITRKEPYRPDFTVTPEPPVRQVEGEVLPPEPRLYEPRRPMLERPVIEQERPDPALAAGPGLPEPIIPRSDAEAMLLGPVARTPALPEPKKADAPQASQEAPGAAQPAPKGEVAAPVKEAAGEPPVKPERPPVDEAALAALKAGDRVEVKVGDEWIPGKIRDTDPSAGKAWVFHGRKERYDNGDSETFEATAIRLPVDEAAVAAEAKAAQAAPEQPAYAPGDTVYYTDKDGAERAAIVKRITEKGRLVVEDLDTGKATRIDGDQVTGGEEWEPVARETPSSETEFGPGSAGAAQVPGTRIPAYEEMVPSDANEIPSSFGGRMLRWDAVGRLKQMLNPFIRWPADRIGEDAVGLNADFSGAAQSAEEAAWILKMRTLGTAHREANAAFAAADTGGRWGRAERRKAWLAQAVQAADEGIMPSDPNLARATQAIKAFFETYRKEGLASGTTYMQGLTEDLGYVPHMLDYEKFRLMAERHGEAKLAQFLADSFILKDLQNGLKTLKRGGKGTAEQDWVRLARAVAEGYVRNVLRRGHWGDHLGPHGLGLDDPSIVDTLVLQGVDRETATELSQAFKVEMDGAGPARARTRFDFEMGHSAKMADGSTLSMKELFSRDFDYLTHSYANQMAGHIAMAKQAGIKNRMEFEKLKAKAADWHRNNPGRDSDRDFEASMKNMDYLYDAITGNPLELDPGSAFSVWARRLRSFNFIRLMTQVGFAQLAEFGRVMGQVGLPAMAKQMPALREVLKLAKDGKLSNPLLRELEAAAGIGTNRMINMPFTGITSELEPVAGAVDKLLHKGRNFVADISGMAHITMIQQRMAAASYSQRLVDKALSGKQEFTREIASLGLDEKMAGKIFEHLKTKALIADGKRLHELRLESWDPAVANAFILGITRMTKRLVQESSFGGTMRWMHESPTAKLLLQFRSFSVNAIYKQTLQGAAQHDAATASAVLQSMLWGGISYVVQTSINESDHEKLQEKLSMQKIGLAAVNRSGASSVMPMLVDSAFSLATAGTIPGPFAHGRSSGLASGAVAGNPTMDLADKALRSIAAVPNAALREDYDFSQADARALLGILPLTNAVGLRRFIGGLTEDLPRESSQENYWSE